MKAELSFAPLAQIETELLAVAALDAQTAKGSGATPQPVLLTEDEGVKSAAAAVLASGEYKAGTNESVPALYSPLASTAAAADFTPSSSVSRTGCGVAPEPLAV